MECMKYSYFTNANSHAMLRMEHVIVDTLTTIAVNKRLIATFLKSNNVILVYLEAQYCLQLCFLL